MPELAVHHIVPEYAEQSSVNGTRSTMFPPARNPYLSKWDIIFDKKMTEWISFKPQLGSQVYPCYVCRHMFGSKNSFLDHVNRRAMLLKYKCSFCIDSDILTFYNPCSLLLHTRQHYTLLSGQINLENLEVGVLPYGLAGFLPDPNIPMLYDVEDDNLGETSFINTRFYSPLSQSRGNPIVNLLPNELLFHFTPQPSLPLTTLVLKQISSNIPRCQFIYLDNNRFVPIPQGLDVDGQALPIAGAEAPIEIIKQEAEEAPQNNVQYNMPIITKIETLDESNHEPPPAVVVPNMENFPRCPECRITQTVSMSQHFVTTNKPFQESLNCSICKYIAPTKCSLDAHERIHESIAPYVCPECGKDFEDWKLLHAHLEEVCFHLAKQVRLRCPGKKCGKIFAQVVTFSAHFVSHMQCWTKCTVCNDVFLGEPEFAQHQKVHDVQPFKIYKCTVCTDGSETYTDSNFEEHIRFHATNRTLCMYVYTCKHCHSYFRSTLTYATHLLRCTKMTPHTNNPYLNPKPLFANELNRRRRRVSFLQVLSTCRACNTHIQMQVEHIDRAPINCANCGNRLNYTNSLKKSNPLILFKDVSETDSSKTNNPNSSSKSSSTETATTNMKKGTCLLCDQRLTTSEMRDHFTLKRCKYHNPVVVLGPKVTYSVKDSPTKSSSTEDSSKSDDGPVKKKRRRASVAASFKSKKLSSLNSETDLSIEPDEVVPFDGTYRCKLCDYSHTLRDEFHKHIIEHRDVCTAMYQCMECGECFVVKPSLMKHLVYYHQVVDTEAYFNENDCFNKEAVEKLEAVMRLAPGETKEPVAENQCRVCLQQFNDERKLNQHLRTHGMAFLFKNLK